MIKSFSKFFLLVMLLNLVASCSSDVVTRNSHGRTPRQQPRDHFNGVKKKVALLTFFNESPYGGMDLGITATEELRRELSRTGEYVFLPTAQKIFGSSKEVYAGGGVRLFQLSRKAKVSGVNFVIFGRIIEARVREKTDEIGVVRETKAYSEAKIEIRVFDVNSNREIFTKVFRGSADDSAFRLFVVDRESKLAYRRELLRYSVKIATRRAIPQMLQVSEKLEWVGRVAKIVGNRIYVNAGRNSGIQVGDVLKVITEGEEIYDPETGALIGQAKGENKGTIEIIDYVGPDGSVGVLHSGSAVQEGDYVQLY